VGFDRAAIATLLDNVSSHARKLGDFQGVTLHEPKSAPLSGLHLAIWVQTITPIQASGLSATSGRVEMNARLYMNFIAKPADGIDPDIMAATADLLDAYTGDFDFGQTLRMVDLLGEHGRPLSAAAGYITMEDRKVFRVMTITVPLIFNDMFIQAP